MTGTTEIRRRYRSIIARPGLAISVGVYDGLSASIAAAAGFEVLTVGGYAALGSMLGGPDIGQSNMRDYADHNARICNAVDLPVTADADTGFGDVHNVRQAVRAFEAAGVAAIMISDQVFPNRCGYMPGKSVVPVEDMLAKLKAALDARRDGSLSIIARTDVRGVGSLDEAIERCQLYLDCGADLAKPQGVDREDEIRRAVAEVPCPFLATLSQAAGKARLDFDDLERLGVASVSLPSISLFAAARGVRDVLSRLARTRSLAAVEGELMPLDAYYELVGLSEETARELRYRDEAAHLVQASRREQASREVQPAPGP